MGKKFNEYVLQQPEILGDILKSKEVYVKSFLEHIKADSKCVVLVGSGSSYNAACMVAPYMQELLNMRVECLTPSMILASKRLIEGVYIAISQSGESTSTVGIIDVIHKNKQKVLAICANANSAVAKNSDGYVPIMCGDECIGPKTKGVSATMMTLLACGVEFAKAHDTMIQKDIEIFEKDLNKVPEYMHMGIQHGLKLFMDRTQEFTNAGYMMLVSNALSEPAIREGALKLLETCWTPVFPYEFEEFMHGVHYSIGKGNTIIFFSNEADSKRMDRLMQFSNENGAKAFVVDIPVKEDSVVRSFYLLGVFSNLCAQLSVECRIDCDVARYASFGKYMKTKRR